MRNREASDERGQAHVSRLLLTMLFWLCPASDHHNLSYIPSKFYF